MSSNRKVHLSNKDKEYFRSISRSGFLSIDYGRSPTCGLEGNEKVPYWRFRRLITLGLLASNKDGLFDDCPQTYSIVPQQPKHEDQESS